MIIIVIIIIIIIIENTLTIIIARMCLREQDQFLPQFIFSYETDFELNAQKL
jgi:hypothetical protein